MKHSSAPEAMALSRTPSSLIALANVRGDADDLGVVLLAQPGDDDGSVEAARVGECDFANHAVSAIRNKYALSLHI